MAEQLLFDLPFRVAMGRADFFLSEANAAAVAGIDAWRDWPMAKMLLIGPEGAGKTHLAHVWAAQSGAEVVAAGEISERDVERLADAAALAIEDVDRIASDTEAETRLFHLHNALAARTAPLLLTARSPASRWPLGLPDLASRMAQAGQLTLSPPDDALLSAVLVKLAQDRQLALTPPLVLYALPRIERSFASAQRFIDALDHRAVATGKRPTLPLVRDVLDGLG